MIKFFVKFLDLILVQSSSCFTWSHVLRRYIFAGFGMLELIKLHIHILLRSAFCKLRLFDFLNKVWEKIIICLKKHLCLWHSCFRHLRKRLIMKILISWPVRFVIIWSRSDRSYFFPHPFIKNNNQSKVWYKKIKF